ncbi:MAG: hypothetical protein WBB45_00625 [Cyclobacteriaceae bacterium]
MEGIRPERVYDQKVADKIINKLTEEHINLIVIGLGGNDAFMLNRPPRWKAEIRNLIDALAAKFPKPSACFALCHR